MGGSRTRPAYLVSTGFVRSTDREGERQVHKMRCRISSSSKVVNLLACWIQLSDDVFALLQKSPLMLEMLGRSEFETTNAARLGSLVRQSIACPHLLSYAPSYSCTKQFLCLEIHLNL